MNFILSLILLLSPQAEGTSRFQVLAPGFFHGNEVTAQTGEIWMGLFADGERNELLPLELQVNFVYDALLDNEGEQTGLEVLNAGTLPLLYLHSEDAAFAEGDLQPILFGIEDVEIGDVFQLTADESLEVRKKGFYYLMNGQEQRICDSYENLHGEGLSITWVGDLDGDGLTDLILDNRGHYAIPMGLRVFLSSQAEENELVHLVAEFVTVSC